MSDNEKINHLLERASPLCLSLEEVELQWSIKRTLESTGGSVLSVLGVCGCRLGKRYFSIQAMQQKSPETQPPLKRRVERNQYHYWQCKSMCAERASQWMKPGGFHWGQEGQCCNYAGRLQMVASLCFSQTLITLCERSFSCRRAAHLWIPGCFESSVLTALTFPYKVYRDFGN